MRIQHGLILLCLMCASIVYGQGGRKQIEDGNKLYAEEKYDEANNKYRDALIDNPESPIVNFNIGDVLYKKRNFEEAIKSFEKATSADDILLQGKSYYNMGNSLYKMGKMPESVMMYKKALELNPNDEDAKYNLEYVRAQLKDQAQDQSQQNQDQQQQQEQQDQQQQQNQDQNQEDQEQEEQQQEPQQDQSEQQEQQQQEQDQQAGQEQEISKEDAQRILDALDKDEQDLLQKQRAKKPGRAYRGKDW